MIKQFNVLTSAEITQNRTMIEKFLNTFLSLLKIECDLSTKDIYYSKSFVSAPAIPSIRVHSNYGYFENKVVIESVTSNPGSFDTFSAYLSPAHTNTSYANINITNAAFNSTDLELTNLDGATEYILTVQVEKRHDACGITEAGSLFNTKSVAVCTGLFELVAGLNRLLYQNTNK